MKRLCLALLVLGGCGWLLYEAAAYLAANSSAEIRLYRAGFGSISNAAEMICFAGRAGSIVMAFLCGLPTALVYVRRAGVTVRVATLNMVGAVLLLCGAGSVGLLFGLALAGAPLLWTAAVIWALVYPVQLAAAATGGPVAALGSSGARGGPPSVS